MNEEIYQAEHVEIDLDKNYKVHNVCVLENTGEERTTNHNCMLVLTKESTTEVVSNNKYTTIGLTPIPRDVLGLKNNIDSLIGIHAFINLLIHFFYSNVFYESKDIVGVSLQDLDPETFSLMVT